MISLTSILLLLSCVHADDLYNGLYGPARWGQEKKYGSNQCLGRLQSPINFELADTHFGTTLNGIMTNNGSFPNVAWSATGTGKLKNLGEELKYYPTYPAGSVTIPDGNFTRPDGVYDMIQFHIHSPSEHRIDGRSFAAEFHFVHKKQGGSELAVIGVFVDFANVTDPFTSAFINAGKDLAPLAYASFSPNYSSVISGLKASPKIFRYTGSLTTPPCTEGVKWHVASSVFLTISPDDYKSLKNVMPFNSRMTQPLYYVSDSNWATNRKSDYYA